MFDCKKFFQLCIGIFFSLLTEVISAQVDSIPMTDSVMAAEVSEDVLQDYVIQTIQPFACRAFSTLLTQRDGYTSSMGRKDNSSRVTSVTGGFQFLAKVNRKTTLGLTMTGRKLMIHDRLASSAEIFKPDSGQNSETYFRYLIIQSRYNLLLKHNQLFVSGNIFIPLSREKEIIYGKRKFQDPIYRQFNTQFIFFRRYSRYFSFNRGITATWRLTGKTDNALIIRGFLLPVFQHRLSSRVYITASAELNALFVKPFFNNLYLNEKAGVLYNGPFGILYSFQYGYYALGKNTNAQHSFNVSLKREFKAIPVKVLRAS